MNISSLIHIDESLLSIISQYGPFTYLILFAIIFLETGLVITPFLPGDSLLFVAGVLAAQNLLNVYFLFILLTIAAIAGDSMNYAIGKYLGKKVFSGSRFFKKEYLKRTEKFYDKYGSKTIVLARFIPIVRTFAPFVAGIGKMNYSRFISYNILGGILWVAIFTFGGYFFGNVPLVKENLTIVILIIIFLSILPAIIEILRNKKHK